MKERLEKEIETASRVVLHKAGGMVMKHHVDNRGQKPCPSCGHVDKQRGARTGLGIGVSDLIIIVPPMGRFLGIEMKRPSTINDTSDEQDRWLEQVRRHGGISGVADSEEKALALFEEARRGGR